MVQGVPGGLWLRVSRLMAYVFVTGFCAALSLHMTAQLASTFADCWPVAALYRGHEMSRIELVLAGQAAPHFRSAGETIVPSGDEPPAAEVGNVRPAWIRPKGSIFPQHLLAGGSPKHRLICPPRRHRRHPNTKRPNGSRIARARRGGRSRTSMLGRRSPAQSHPGVRLPPG